MWSHATTRGRDPRRLHRHDGLCSYDRAKVCVIATQDPGFLQPHDGRASDRILNEIRCIDSFAPVELPMVQAGTPRAGVKDPRVSPYRAASFTKPFHPARHRGVSTAGNLRTSPAARNKVLYRYDVLVTIPGGEALPFLIPNTNRYLRFVPLRS